MGVSDDFEGSTTPVLDKGGGNFSSGGVLDIASYSALESILAFGSVLEGVFTGSEELAADADELIVLRMPVFFGAVGQFYKRFEQVGDDEVVAALKHNMV